MSDAVVGFLPGIIVFAIVLGLGIITMLLMQFRKKKVIEAKSDSSDLANLFPEVNANK